MIIIVAIVIMTSLSVTSTTSQKHRIMAIKVISAMAIQNIRLDVAILNIPDSSAGVTVVSALSSTPEFTRCCP